MPSSKRRTTAILAAPTSRAATAWRLLRFRLRHAGDPRIIAVTSAGPGEGAIDCAANLGAALAEDAGARVLTLDVNIDQGGIEDYFPVEDDDRTPPDLPTVGGEVLEIRTAVTAISMSLAVGKLRHVEAGRSVDGVRFAALLRALEVDGEFSHIVVATPPILAVPDANLIADAVDGVVLAVRAFRTTMPGLDLALRRLAPRRVLGVVLMDSLAR